MVARRVGPVAALLLFLLPGLSQTAFSATYWIRPAPHGQNYNDVQCFPNGVAWTVADAGRLTKSSDYGATWQMVDSFKGVGEVLSAVAFASLTRGLVASKSGRIFLTWDGGATWSAKQVLPAGGLIDADWADTTTALALNSGGVLRSVDGGLNWTTLPFSPGTLFKIHHVTGSLWFLVGVTGIYKSTDNGSTWTNVKTGAFFNIDFTDANNGIAVGSGIIVRTANGGATWTSATGSVSESNFGIKYATPSVVAVATFAGTVVRSIDGGASWTLASLPPERFPMWAVAFFDASRGLALGSYGQILYTGDGGATWSTSTLRLDQLYGQVEKISDIARATPQTWFAAALSGLYRTTDNGVTFSRLKTGSWTSVSFSSSLNGVALGFISGFGIWHTTDGGNTWTGSNPPLPTSTDVVRFGPGGVALIVGDHRILRSTDGGASWTSVYYSPCGNCLMFGIGWADANTVCVAGIVGLRSTDGGATWSALSALNGSADVSFGTPLVGAAVGSFATSSIIRTVDGGATWNALPTQLVVNPPPGLRRISMSDAYTGWAVSDSGIVMHTINGGGTWTRTPSTTNDPLYVVQAVDDSTAVIAGDLGGALIVLTSHPAERPLVWNLSATGTSATLYDVAFGTPATGVMCASGGLVLRTTDGGATWTTIPAAPAGTTLYGVTFVSPTVAVCVGTGGTVLRSTDAGATWSPVTSGTSAALLDVGFASSTVGCAAGQGVMIRTTDGGATWSPVANPAPAGTNIYGVAFGDALTGLNIGFGGAGGNIQRTTDGGATWTTVATYPTTLLIDVAFATPTTAAVVTAGGAFFVERSTDAGLTWTIANAEAPQPLYGVCFVSGTEGYAVGLGSTVLRTTDAGLTWLFEPTAVQPPPAPLLATSAGLPGLESFVPASVLAGPDLYGASVRAGGGAIVVGTSGTALLHDPPATTSVADLAARPVARLVLAPVRPNPSSRAATIEFTLAVAAHARVRIYSVTGAEVATLADGMFAAGPHTLRWSPPRATCGVYFVAVEAGRGERVSRKFVVLR